MDAAAAEGGETLGQDGHEQDELHLKIFKSAASGIKNRCCEFTECDNANDAECRICSDGMFIYSFAPQLITIERVTTWASGPWGLE